MKQVLQSSLQILDKFQLDLLSLTGKLWPFTKDHVWVGEPLSIPFINVLISRLEQVSFYEIEEI